MVGADWGGGRWGIGGCILGWGCPSLDVCADGGHVLRGVEGGPWLPEQKGCGDGDRDGSMCSCVPVTSACAGGAVSAALPGPLPLGRELGAVPLPSPAGKPGEAVSRPRGAPAAPALTWDWSKERGSDLQGAPPGGLGAAGRGLAAARARGRCWGQGLRCPCPFPVDALWSSRPRQEGGKMDPAFLLRGAFHPHPYAASEGAGLDPPQPQNAWEGGEAAAKSKHT